MNNANFYNPYALMKQQEKMQQQSEHVFKCNTQIEYLKSQYGANNVLNTVTNSLTPTKEVIVNYIRMLFQNQNLNVEFINTPLDDKFLKHCCVDRNLLAVIQLDIKILPIITPKKLFVVKFAYCNNCSKIILSSKFSLEESDI